MLRKGYLLIFVILLLFACTKKPDNVLTVKVTKLSGDVQLFRAEKQVELKLNMVLLPQDRIITGENSGVDLLVSDYCISRINEKTEIAFEELYNKEQASKSRMKIISGRIVSILKKLGKDTDYYIQTPTAVCGVRGTTFVVDVSSYEKKEFTKIAVFSGKVEITSQEEPEKIVSVSEFTEASIVGGNIKTVRMQRIGQESIKAIKEVVDTEEIDKNNLIAIRDEFISNEKEFEGVIEKEKQPKTPEKKVAKKPAPKPKKEPAKEMKW